MVLANPTNVLPVQAKGGGREVWEGEHFNRRRD